MRIRRMNIKLTRTLTSRGAKRLTSASKRSPNPWGCNLKLLYDELVKKSIAIEHLKKSRTSRQNNVMIKGFPQI